MVVPSKGQGAGLAEVPESDVGFQRLASQSQTPAFPPWSLEEVEFLGVECRAGLCRRKEGWGPRSPTLEAGACTQRWGSEGPQCLS